MTTVFLALIAALLIYELASLASKQEESTMNTIRHPLAAFHNASRKRKIGGITVGAFLAIAGTALAFYLLGLTGAGSGSVQINGATTSNLGASSLRVVIKGADAGQLDVGQTAPAGVWFASNQTPLANGQYQITGVQADALTVDSVHATAGCQAAWFTVGTFVPNPLWATDGNANHPAGSGTQFPEVFAVNEPADFAATLPGINGTDHLGAEMMDGTTNPNGAIGQADPTLDPTATPTGPAQQISVNGYGNNATAVEQNAAYELATTTVQFTPNQTVDQNACDGATLTVPIHLGIS